MNNPTRANATALIDELLTELDNCHQVSKETPLVNPYQQLSYRLLKNEKFERLTNGVVKSLTVKSLMSRAKRGQTYLKETDLNKNKETLYSLFAGIAKDKSFKSFQKLTERAIAGIVITGHPTFGFSAEQYNVLAAIIEKSVSEEEGREQLMQCTARPDDGLTLEYEFRQSENGLINLQMGILELYKIVAKVAQEHYPEDWKNLDLNLISVASWVGFDVDGRDDITWIDSVVFRLRMAVRQCEVYKSEFLKVSEDKSIIAQINELETYFKNALNSLPADLNNVDEIRFFARQMVDDKPTDINCNQLADNLSQLINASDNDEVLNLIAFKGLVRNFRTGFSHIHFRLNSVQLHNAIRPLVAMEKDPDDVTSRRRYMRAAHKILDQIDAKTIGFENIQHEQTTAKRLFMIIAQFLKYFDADTPIRFLIAESDTPFTVLAALCYAKMFGVEDKVDISPLFETDQALRRGSEVIEELLENPHYFAYVKKRKRLCIQAGYSDAGRYLGQVAAGLAIERLRIKVIKLWDKFDLDDVELLIFDTGGESVGRGAHPDGFGGRLNYMHTPHARRLIQKRNMAYKQEFSLQGGDGYLWLQTPKMAFATLCRVVENMLAPVSNKKDPFYKNTDWSLDFFLTVKDHNRKISLSPDYMKLISLLGTDISFPSGSRMTIRSDEGVVSQPLEKLTQIRAIPNNMLLHQLGYLANSLGGVGTAISQDEYGFWKMYENSPRLQHIMVMVKAAVDVTDEDFLGAYTSLFRPRYWMHTARYEEESHDHDRMLRLAKLLEKEGVFEGLNRIELTLREDLMYLRDGLKDDAGESNAYQLDAEEKQFYTLLHVIRMVLVQKIFLLITRIPRFRDHKGLTVSDLVLRILRFQVSPTLILLREIFPLEGAYEIDPENPEKITFLPDDTHGYQYENTKIFDEIENAYLQIRNISQAISAYIGAIG